MKKKEEVDTPRREKSNMTQPQEEFIQDQAVPSQKRQPDQNHAEQSTEGQAGRLEQGAQ